MDIPLLPATRPGKRKKPIVLTQAEIRHAVDDLLQTDYSNVRSIVLSSLYQFVTLTESAMFSLTRSQVAISDKIASFSRTLRRYKSAGLISPVSYDVMKKVRRAGCTKLEEGHVIAYVLGPIGEEYVRRKGWNGSSPFQPNPNEEDLAHDLICAETMLQMQQLWQALPEDKRGLIEVCGPRQVSVWDTEKNKAVVVPDGLLIKRRQNGEFERAFLVEYQNVRALIQVQTKIKKYEEIAKPEYRWVWDSWGLDEMPWVLVIYRQGATLHHYEEQIEAHGETLARYAATSLEDIWAGRLSIKPIKKG